MLLSTYQSSLELLGEHLKCINNTDIPGLNNRVGGVHMSLISIPSRLTRMCPPHLRERLPFLVRTYQMNIMSCASAADDYVVEIAAGKGGGLMITIPVGMPPMWPVSDHGRLILAIYFSFIAHRPWRLKGSSSRPMDGLLRIGLSGMWKEAFRDGTRSVLRKFIDSTWTLDNISSSVMCGILHGNNRGPVCRKDASGC